MYNCCGKEYTKESSYKGHLRMAKAHKTGAVQTESTQPGNVTPKFDSITPTKNEEVVFRSPMFPFLRVVIQAEDWVPVEISPGRTKLRPMPGKRIEFEQGIFKTSDPEVIAFLKDRYRSSNPETARTPVTWVGKEW